MLDQFKMGPNLVRGFAPNGIGPRDISYYALTGSGDALGGSNYWGASFEIQYPFWFLPKEVGMKGAVYADAGSLWGYKGPKEWTLTGETNAANCTPATKTSVGSCAGLQYDDSKLVRTSIGVGVIWASPFGPLRFDYAIPLTKGKFDTVQEFKFGGGTSF
jgi:outer membrane protein insertion porin family